MRPSVGMCVLIRPPKYQGLILWRPKDQYITLGAIAQKPKVKKWAEK